MVSSKGAHVDAVAREHDPVVFQVLADLEDAGILEERLQERRARRRAGSGPARRPSPNRSSTAAVLERDVGRRGPGASGERDADEVGEVGVERAGLGVDRDDALPRRPRRSRPRAAPSVRDGLVGRGVEGLRRGLRRAPPTRLDGRRLDGPRRFRARSRAGRDRRRGRPRRPAPPAGRLAGRRLRVVGTASPKNGRRRCRPA